MTVVSMNYLLEAGVHFGHQKRRWNPKMKEYIYTTRDDIYIIDLQKTSKLIEEAYLKIKEIAENGGTFLFVGTKKQAQEAMEESAKRTNMFYVNQRWLGGTLTNFRTIRSRIKRLDEVEKMEEDKTLELLPKKEVIKIKKEYDKLNKNLCGIREMNKLPNALIIVDPRTEETAIKEARKLKIPVFGIVDTNCDPDLVDYVIPANDDAVRAVKLVIGALTNAIAETNGNEVINYIDESGHDKEIFDAEFKTESPKKDFEEKREYRKHDGKYEGRKEYRKDFKKDYKKDFKKEEIKEETKKEEKVEIKEEIKETKQEIKEEKTTKENTDLESLTLTELKNIAKEKNIKGYSTMKKAELIEKLR